MNFGTCSILSNVLHAERSYRAAAVRSEPHDLQATAGAATSVLCVCTRRWCSHLGRGGDRAYALVLCDGGGGVTADWGALFMVSSSMMAPFALQVSNCLFVSPLTLCNLVPSRVRASSRFARLAPRKSAPL